MPNESAQFTRNALVPEGSTSNDTGGTYQLTNASVNPTRIIGRDEYGFPIEESIPAAYYERFVHPCGAINKVPLRTGPGDKSMEPEAVAYETREMQRLLTSGWLPLWCCPHTSEWSHIVRGPLVKPGPGVEACEGKPEGCAHMQDVIKKRSDKWMKRYLEDEERNRKMAPDQIAKLADALVEIADTRRGPDAIKGNRAALRKEANE